MKPSVAHHRNALQLSYDLPHRIFATQVYPARSPNGSTIIIYGHEKGLRVLWYGGKPFKHLRTDDHKPAINGAGAADNMVIDLDDEETGAGHDAPPAVFEDEEDEADPSEPFRKVIRHIDISFGTGATQIAVPIPPGPSYDPSQDAFPPILSSHIVVAAACADLSIRLTALPLSPPSPTSTDPASWQMHNLEIGRLNSHSEPISSIAITHTADNTDSLNAEQSKSRSASRNRKDENATPLKRDWSFVVASTSCSGAGLLLVHQIAVSEGEPFSHGSILIQRQYLRSRLLKCKVKFNTSHFPAERHSNLLITIPDSSCVKVYQVFPVTPHPRGRRGSAATIDSTASSSRTIRAAPSLQGRVLITLHPGFLPPSELGLVGRRKQVLDSAWVFSGCSIITLLEDGEWGIWDLEAAGPSSSSTFHNLVRGQNSVTGISGGALTRFAMRGSIAPINQMIAKSRQDGTKDPNMSALAPMTPYTRKIRSDGLFKGNNTMTAASPATSEHVKGDISVTEYAVSKSKLTVMDGSILFSYNGNNVFIPSLLTCWRSQTTSEGSFDAATLARPVTLPAISLAGESPKTIIQLNIDPSASSSRLLEGNLRSAPDYLVATDHRLIFSVAPIIEPLVMPDNEDSFIRKLTGQAASKTDQFLLKEGELDIDGVDRILQDMTNGASNAPEVFGKSVSFQDEDEMDMGTPSQTRTDLGRETPVARQSRDTRARLFT